MSDTAGTPEGEFPDNEFTSSDFNEEADPESIEEDLAVVAGEDDPAPAEVEGFDIDITEGDGPLLEGGDDVDTGSAGGHRAGL